MSESVTVCPSDMWALLMCTIRYSMGRRSYMPSECAVLYDRYKRALAREQKEQIAREIEREIERAGECGATLGDECDHEVWVTLAAQIRREVQP